MTAGSTAVAATKARATPHLREFLADTLTSVSVFSRLRALTDFRCLFESIRDILNDCIENCT